MVEARREEPHGAELPGAKSDDIDSITASLDDGILRVTVPKPEQARPRRVEIQTPSGNGAPAEPAATT